MKLGGMSLNGIQGVQLMADEEKPIVSLAKSRLGDASLRLRYQHEFSVEDFKMLTLINGGAIIALLTYTGHSTGTDVASKLADAFLAYTGGLVAAALAYLGAYESQGSLMNHDVLEAYRLLGFEARDGSNPDDYARRGTIKVYLAMSVCVLSLGAFIAGSWLAMSALT
jgi:hypothetical protein